MEARDGARRTSTVDLEAVSNRLNTQAQKLQFGLLPSVDFVFKRFREDNPEEVDLIDKMKEELMVEVVMRAVNTIRGQSKVIRELARGNLTISNQRR